MPEKMAESNVGPDWDKIIQDWLALDHENSAMLFGEPSSESEINSVEAALNVSFPAEFRSLYKVRNGFGHKYPEETRWSFAPLSSIEALSKESCSWFKETHPDYADRFIAFIDWGDGSTCGYGLADDRSILPGIYEFDHDLYEFDVKQDINDFLVIADSSIESFLDLAEA